ncbi:MAG: TRAP transporter small permease subunit [Proteobacteria bacterium]|nr:TRAP transporter small permease subunit [Pseudomonadota bacterium]
MIKKLSKIISFSFETVSVAFLVCVLVTVVLQVFFRYVARIVVPWTEEAARYFCIWMVFMGVVAAVAQEAHIRITFLVERVPKLAMHLFSLLSYCVVFLFNIIILLGSIQLVKLNWGQEAVTFPISVGVLYLAITVSSATILILLIFIIVQRLRTIFGRDGK